MGLYPPFGPIALDLTGLGLPIVVHWYGVILMSGAMLAGYLSSRRAAARGEDPEDVWNLLMLGLLFGVVGARAYYVIFEWPRFAGKDLLFIINPQTGGLAIHGAIIGAMLATVIFTRRRGLDLLKWLDMCMPTFMLAQAVGRWANFINQEAYGRPTNLPFGLIIDQQHRLPPYDDMAQYPPGTLFHATFLYESLWNLVGFGLLLWIERRFAGWLKKGDIALLYACWYGLGRLWVESFRTDSICSNGIGGECGGALRVAQIASILLLIGGLAGLAWQHRSQARAATA